jgi:glycosyltransferase involved in cell wall biosynthesis
MTSEPRASVVIPAFNAAGTIERAVRAAAGPDVEVIVCDDGSTDTTAELASEAGAAVLRLPHGGQSVARNAGMEAARAPVIICCDADDWLAPDAVSRFLDAFSPGVGAVGGRVEVVGEAKPRWWPPEDVSGDVDVDDFLRANWIAMPAAIRRDLALKLGGFDPVLSHTMDYNLWIRAAAVERVVVLAEIVGYVDRSRPSFSSDRVGALKDRLVMLERLIPDVAPEAKVRPVLARTANDLSRIVRSPIDRWRWRRRARAWAQGASL